MTRAVTKAMLKNIHRTAGALRPFFYCPKCRGEYSANAADYFMTPDSHVFKCCNVNSALVTEQRLLTSVEID